MPRIALAIALAAGLAGARRAPATEGGAVLADARLRTVDGGTQPVVDAAAGATVLVFFRPGQDRSVEALRGLAGCRGSLDPSRARILGVVSDQAAPDDVRAALATAGTMLPVLVDAGDALYGQIGVRTHPTLAFVDRARRVVAVDAYHQVGTCDVLRARVRRLLGDGTDAEVARALAPAASQLPGEDPLGVARRHVNFGRKLLATRAYAEAHRNARKSLELAPSAAAWALEGEIFAAEGRCGEAARAFDSALKLDPRDERALAGRGACPRASP